jgi:WD40 repeat protein
MRRTLVVLTAALVVSGWAVAGTALAQSIEEIAVLPAEDSAIMSLAIGGDGRWLAALIAPTDDRKAELRFWDLKSRKRIDPPPASKLAESESGEQIDEPCFPLRMSPRSDLLAIDFGSIFRLHRFRAEPTPHVAIETEFRRERQGTVVSTQVSDDGKRMLYTRENTIFVSLPDGRKVGDMDAGGYASVIRASPDFATIAVATYQDVDLYDFETKKVRASLLDHRGKVEQLAFSADGKILVVASSRLDSENRGFANIKLWNAAAAKEIASLPETKHGASGLWIDATAGRFLLATTAYYDHRKTECQTFDRGEGKWNVLDFKDAKGRGPNCIAANGSLTLLAAGFSDGVIRLYDLPWPAKK